MRFESATAFPSIATLVFTSLAACLLLVSHRKKNPSKPIPNVNPSTEETIIEFAYVGKVKSGFHNKRGVPRQGALAPAVKARIEIFPDSINGDCLEGLEKFSHAWIVFIFSRNTNQNSVQKWKRDKSILFKSKIRPPTLGGKKVGVFSTRSPHRPNPIGMTLAKIEYVDYKNGILELSGVDLCDETPILDIKPYVPADRPLKNEIKYADWVLKEAERKYQVIFTDTARSGLLACHGGLFRRSLIFVSESTIIW